MRINETFVEYCRFRNPVRVHLGGKKFAQFFPQQCRGLFNYHHAEICTLNFDFSNNVFSVSILLQS